MSEKQQCPGCFSYSSAINQAIALDNPCPNCGLSARSIIDVLAVRLKYADGELKAKLEEFIIRAGRAEFELTRLRYQLDEIRNVLSKSQSL